MKQTPSVNRMVHIYHSDLFPGSPRPGIITGVNDDGTVDVHVLFRNCDVKNNVLPCERQSNVEIVENDEGRPAGVFVATWPPFVPPIRATDFGSGEKQTPPPLTDAQRDALRDEADKKAQDADGREPVTMGDIAKTTAS